MGIFAILLVVTSAVLIVYGISSYKRLVSLRHNLKAAWSHIEVALKQRHDELPKLVIICAQYMKHEQQALEKLSLARSQVSTAMQNGNLAELGVAESMMSNSMGRLFSLTENYPELKTNESFMRLQSRIITLQNTIADRREIYNDSVNQSNAAVGGYPAKLIANWFSFKSAPLFQVAESEPADVYPEGLLVSGLNV